MGVVFTQLSDYSEELIQKLLKQGNNQPNEDEE